MPIGMCNHGCSRSSLAEHKAGHIARTSAATWCLATVLAVAQAHCALCSHPWPRWQPWQA